MGCYVWSPGIEVHNNDVPCACSDEINIRETREYFSLERKAVNITHHYRKTTQYRYTRSLRNECFQTITKLVHAPQHSTLKKKGAIYLFTDDAVKLRYTVLYRSKNGAWGGGG